MGIDIYGHPHGRTSMTESWLVLLVTCQYPPGSWYLPCLGALNPFVSWTISSTMYGHYSYTSFIVPITYKAAHIHSLQGDLLRTRERGVVSEGWD